MLKIAFNRLYAHPLPEGHRFPMEKYSLLPEQLQYEGTLSAENFFDPEPVLEEDVLRIHDPEYFKKLQEVRLTRREERATGFPLSKQLVERELAITGGTVKAVEYALKYGVAGNIAGGTHHAYRDRGEGFCLLNCLLIVASLCQPTQIGKLHDVLLMGVDELIMRIIMKQG